MSVNVSVMEFLKRDGIVLVNDIILLLKSLRNKTIVPDRFP